MRILIVALADSIHVVRWIGQITDLGWDVHLFPSIDTGSIHSELANVTVYHSVYHKRPVSKQVSSVKRRGLRIYVPFLNGSGKAQQLLEYVAHFARFGLEKYEPDYRAKQLQRVIKRIQPDIIHSMELQAGGYLTLQARNDLGDCFPAWIITNYGSDIYFFGRLSGHQDRLRALLAFSDYYTSECERDIELARNMGFQGEVLGVAPVGGGFNLKEYEQYRQPGAVSQRKLVLVKGYQHWAGRALVALRALALCGDALQGYEIAVHSPSSIDVAYSAELVAQQIGIPIQLIPRISHEEMLRLYGRARVHVGLSISDAASTSMLESIVMGAFPIQSNTACVDEWIVDGETGLAVPPEDPDIVAAAIQRALQDDALVDNAADKNILVAAQKLDHQLVREKVIGWYHKVYEQGKVPKH